jgi:hypothetical protein
MVCPPALSGSESGFRFAKDVGTRTTLPVELGGPGLSWRDDGRTRAIMRPVSRVRTLPPGVNASGIHRGAKPVSQCLGSDERPCGDAAGLRLKRASGPLQWESAFQAEPERSGIRTHDPMINIHLLYPTELSFVVLQTGIEPATFGYYPDALPLSYYRVFTRRNTKPETGPRQSGSQRARTHGQSEGAGQ